MKDEILKIINDIPFFKVRNPPSKCQRRILFLEARIAEIKKIVEGPD